MSTRSYIAIKQPNNKYLTAYCHWDGYLSYVGAVLQKYYTNPLRVSRLIQSGDMSKLAPRICPAEDSKHNFDHPDKDVCVFYGRDRGEQETEARYLKPEELFDPKNWIEYVYVFDPDSKTWSYADLQYDKERDANCFSALKPLAPAVEKYLDDVDKYFE